MSNTLTYFFQHPLSRDNPFTGLVRFLSWQIRGRLSSSKIRFKWLDDSVLMVSKGMTGATGNIYYGLHEYADMAFVLHFLERDDLFLDVGANIGSYTVLASKLKKARTISFEPDPITAQHLQENILANNIDNLVIIEKVAVGDKSGTTSFTIGKDTVNQIATSDDKNTRTVEMKRIDEVAGASEAILMKLDVEGFELMALKGATQLLAGNNLMAIETETVEPEIHDMLKENGFSRYWYDPRNRTLYDHCVPDILSSNALYLRNKDFIQERLSSSKNHTWLGLTF